MATCHAASLLRYLRKPSQKTANGSRRLAPRIHGELLKLGFEIAASPRSRPHGCGAGSCILETVIRA